MKKSFQILCLCLAAGLVHAAKTVAPGKPQPILPPVVLSIYQPQNSRDPFLAVGEGMTRPSTNAVTPAPRKINASLFHLQNIINVLPRPSAQVNDMDLFLNKPAEVETTEGTFKVKLIQIRSKLVTIEVEGQRIELKFEE